LTSAVQDSPRLIVAHMSWNAWTGMSGGRTTLRAWHINSSLSNPLTRMNAALQ